MKIVETQFKGLLEIQLTQFKDERGIFFESFKQSNYSEFLSEINFVQDNCSISKLNVLRGLHFQLPPFAQAKLVHVIKGAALDVVVDLRKNSQTFGKHFSIELNEYNGKQLFIPRGFAHGFCSLKDQTIFSYKCDNFYNSESERTLLFNDYNLGINWPEREWLISEKDLEGLSLNDFDSPF